ncbi:MAG TPA: cysteine--tRNA ligase [Candidatus Dormibacteraeota bacterium]|nr:cysteine--tRNA ligase [Candidatus Dormibacteraeota bacterium]
MLRLYDTLSREIRKIEPLKTGRLTMYSCGPTVYRSVHIGNLRSYLMADWIKRVARAQGWDVLHVKNITDVGHMRQEMAERGGDKVIAAALAAGRTPREIAGEFEEEFHRAEKAMGIEPADVFPRATDHIPQMLILIDGLLRRGLAYRVGGTVYFDTAAYPDYGHLSGNAMGQLQLGVEVELDPSKRHPADFTLWREADPGRQLMVWDSAYGMGFPGWHIECSAMSMAYLGEQIDIHTGGVDNIFPHHEDERAQSEGATGRQFVRQWVHGQHLLADGIKMAKSSGNVYTVDDLVQRGFDPLSFRFLCATVRYRTRLNFTLSSLEAADRGLQRLRRVGSGPTEGADPEAAEQVRTRVQSALEDDLNLPRALADLFRFAGDNQVAPATRALGLREADSLLGLGLDQPPSQRPADGPWVISAGARERQRAAREFPGADREREALLAARVVPEDNHASTAYRRATASDLRRGLVSSPRQVVDMRGEPDSFDISVSVVTSGYPEDLRRCLDSVRRNQAGHRVEVLVVDNDAGPACAAVLAEAAGSDPNLRVFHADHQLGEGAARNITIRAALGQALLILDTGVELVGDCFSPILEALADPGVGAVGRWGARSSDMRDFFDSDEREVDAIDGYCLAVRRHRFTELGLLDERFRFYRMLDFHLCFTLRSAGLVQMRLPELSAVMHEHRGWEDTEPDERERLSKLNFRRFYERWHHRPDLLLAGHPGLPSH